MPAAGGGASPRRRARRRRRSGWRSRWSGGSSDSGSGSSRRRSPTGCGRSTISSSGGSRTSSGNAPSYASTIATIRKHLVGSKELGRLRSRRRQPGEDRSLPDREGTGAERAEREPPSRVPRRAFNMGRRMEKFPRPNPVADVPKRKVPKRLPDYLRPDEVPPLLASREAEVAGAVRDGDLHGAAQGRAVRAAKDGRRSRGGDHHGRADRTIATRPKNGRADAVPINSELLAHYLEQAIRTSPSDLVFPAPNGKMFRKHTQLELVLRRAMRRAGLVTGYVHKCRRKACGHQEPAADANPRRCPKCNFKLSRDRAGPGHPVPPLAAHDRLAAAHERRRPGRGPADHAAPGPAHDDRVLRPPGSALPQARGGAPPLRPAGQRAGGDSTRAHVAATRAPGTAEPARGGWCPGVAAARRPRAR